MDSFETMLCRQLAKDDNIIPKAIANYLFWSTEPLSWNNTLNVHSKGEKIDSLYSAVSFQEKLPCDYFYYMITVHRQIVFYKSNKDSCSIL